MLDINLVYKNSCYGFALDKTIREPLYITRKHPNTYIPASIKITVRKPIIKLFNGAIKALPICFGRHVTMSKDTTYNPMVAVMPNYFSYMAGKDKEFYMPNRLYMQTPIGHLQLLAAKSIDIHRVLFLGRDEDTLVDTRQNNKSVIDWSNEAETMLTTFSGLYHMPEKPGQIRKTSYNIGLHCILCIKRNECV